MKIASHFMCFTHIPPTKIWAPQLWQPSSSYGHCPHSEQCACVRVCVCVCVLVEMIHMHTQAREFRKSQYLKQLKCDLHKEQVRSYSAIT